ncbi:hypothetical protein ISF_05047 [Cordyceps fumosorosea ARSEF 2679]|uniref:Uncharacterized protein n=1 Tax=Cordyceps fumosorosea (strain ARSEF 2679) TaxID=1081104 RepID=A0A167W081_CORFA|nr:hypothetical protein ISF_05047 [Cordyceps fumosorosea ARSEF 2679]OAA63171.1 hypothetical protein ISF_05047 [Cordyceps fumosorosea ARSEF 2679]
MTRGKGGEVVRQGATVRDGQTRDDDDAALTSAATAAPTPAVLLVERPAGAGDDDDDDDPLLWELRALLANPPRRLYRPVRAALLADGHALAAALLVAAALANHVRRVLAPWLGQSPPPAGDAAGRRRAALTAALATTRALLRDRVLADAAARGGGGGASKGDDAGGGGGTGPRASRTTTCLADACRIAYLTLCLMRVEYAYAEACWAASWIYAGAHILLRGTPAERQFTHRLLFLPGSSDVTSSLAHWCGLALIADLLLWWSWRVLVLPARRHPGGLVGVALSGLPVAVGLIGAATAHVVRYANKYFIWLEMSEMLLTWAWLALGLALVVVWRCC